MTALKSVPTDPLSKSRSKAVCSSQYWDIDRRQPSIVHDGPWEWLGITARGEETTIAQNGHDPRWLEMWQGSQNLCVIQKEYCTQNNQMAAVGDISHCDKIIKASWSNCQHDAVAAFTLSDRSPLPPAFSANDLSGGWTPVLDIGSVRRIDCHLAKCDDNSAPYSISDINDWLHWNGHPDIPNESEDNCEAGDDCDVEQDNDIENPQHPVKWNGSVIHLVSKLIWQTPRS